MTRLETPPVVTPATSAAFASVLTPVDRRELLRRFLNIYWLRPENAFWMTLRSAALSRVDFEPRSIDVACGDGVFSFVHAGGAFDEAFDVFCAVDHLDRVHSEAADMFDGAADRYHPLIARAADWRIDVGTDLKPQLLQKAASLDFYRETIEHDSNAPQPFDDHSFATVYSNSAYWMREIDALLHELRRITRAGGRVILHVKLKHLTEYNLEAFRPQLGENFLRIIDRGRKACWPALGTRAQWERRFSDARLDIVHATPFVTRTHAQIWDVGLRPIAPLLVRMANELKPQTRAAIKRDWVALFEQLLEPICDPGFDLFEQSSEPVEMQYVLTPR